MQRLQTQRHGETGRSSTGLAPLLLGLLLAAPAAAQGPLRSGPAPPGPPRRPVPTTEILDELVVPWTPESRPELQPEQVGHIPIPPSTLLIGTVGPNRLPAFHYTWRNLVDYPIAIGLSMDECYSVKWGSTGVARDSHVAALPPAARDVNAGAVYLVAGFAASEGAASSEGSFTPEVYGAMDAGPVEQDRIRERATMRQLFHATRAVKPLRQYDVHPTVEFVIPPRGELSVCLYAEWIHPRMETPMVTIQGVKVATRGDGKSLGEIAAAVREGNHVSNGADGAWLEERERTIEHMAWLHARHFVLRPGAEFDARRAEAARMYREALEADRRRRDSVASAEQLAAIRQEERARWGHSMQGWLLPEPVEEYRVLRTLPRMPLRQAFRGHGFDQQFVGFVSRREDGSFEGRALALREGSEPREIGMEQLKLLLFAGEELGFCMTREVDPNLARGLDALTRAELGRFTERILIRQTGLEDVSGVHESLQRLAGLALASRGQLALR